MQTAIKAGIGYFATVFALGFLLGTGRVLLLAPAVGALLATLIEIPVMLIVSWWLCAWIIRKFGVASELDTRLAMGALAFTLLIAAETALGIWGFDQSPQERFASYHEPEPLLGLVAQIAFATFPLLQVNRK